MSSLYIIAIGGTGAKCAEAIVQATAAGLFTPAPLRGSKVNIIFVDPDEANGNVSRARKTLEIYNNCHALFRNSMTAEGEASLPWMSLPIEAQDIWSPFGRDGRTLIDFFNYGGYENSGLGALFGSLYSKEEREAKLDVGFRGRPAIGAAIMSQVDLEDTSEGIWRDFRAALQRDLSGAGSMPKVFLCGSIFGGTGAAGFPTLGKLIRNELERMGDGDRKVVLGGLLMLPYFQFKTPGGKKAQGVFARSEEFLLKTEAALRYYLERADEAFDLVYLLGDNSLAEVKNFSIGKADQRNDPHYLELYAALAARHLWLTARPSDRMEDRGKVVTLSRSRPDGITWADLPPRESNSLGNNSDAREALTTMTRFAFAWTAGMVPDLRSALKVGTRKFRSGAPWFPYFFRSKTLFSGSDDRLPELESEEGTIQTINAWCENYLGWLAKVHYSHTSPGAVKLFDVGQFADEGDGRLCKQIDRFPYLIFDTAVDRQRQSSDTYLNLLRGLTADVQESIGSPNTGAVGLARALYHLCRPPR